MSSLAGEEMSAVEIFRDESDGETGWLSSSTMSVADQLPVTTYRQNWLTSWGSGHCWRRLRLRRRKGPDQTKSMQRRQQYRLVSMAVVALAVLGIIAGIYDLQGLAFSYTWLIWNSVYTSLIAALLHTLTPPPNHSGLQYILQNWRAPNASGAYEFAWRDDFSRDIVPKKCHSHNDYWRSVPLYSALAAGCTSVEADVWLAENGELLVSHSWKTATQARTLKSLYLNPLTKIFNNRNVSQASVKEKEVGVFDADSNISVVLLIDLKSDGHATWPAPLAQLQPLRNRNWLTYYDGKNMHRGPLTVVGTGNTPLELVQSRPTNRFIFFDAPLLSVSDTTYNSTNSYYASASLKDAIGELWLNRLSTEQEQALKDQIKTVEEKGLKSRYWDTPGWPISLRDMLWLKFTELGVGVLNVDDLESATKWNWHWCVVAGLTLC